MNYSLLRSRTFWTFVLMFIIGGVNAIAQVIPAGLDTAIMLGLTGLGSYFHLQTAVTNGAIN